MSKRQKLICSLAVLAALAGTSAFAQSASAQVTADPAVKTVVVVGKKRGLTIDLAPPRRSLKVADIQAFGADNVEELLNILKPQTQSASGKAPIVLLNGHRVSGFSVLKDIPPEALVRIDTFTEATALAYGYPADQMVLNIVLAPDFKGRTVEASQTGDVRDAGAKSVLKYSHLHIDNNQRVNLSLDYRDTRHALESDRDVVTEVNETNLAPGRNAVPDNRQVEGNLSVSRTLFDSVEVMLEASIKGGRTDSRLGLAKGSLTVPASNPFAISAEGVQIDRYFPEAGTLRQSSSDWSSHSGLSLDGQITTWRWNLIASADHVVSRSRTETGIDLIDVQSTINRNDASLDPYTPLTSVTKTVSDQRSVSDQYMFMVMASSDLIQLPAGPLNLSLNLGGNNSAFASRTQGDDTPQTSQVRQSGLNSQINVNIPLSEEAKSHLPGLGTFVLGAGLSANRASGFKDTAGFNYGFIWVPVSPIVLMVNQSRIEIAPAAASMASDTTETPNVDVFDYVRGENAVVTQVYGGNAALPASRTDTTMINLFITPSPKTNLRLSAGLNLSLTADATGELPAATREAELAFPDRYIRDAEGQLVRIDARPVSYARQQSDQLKSTLDYSCTLASCAWMKIFHLPESRLSVEIDHTKYLRDTVLIRAGLREIDRLKGGITTPGTPQSPSQLEWNIGLTAPIGGVWFSGQWQAGALALGGSAESNLTFSSATIAKLRIFANLGHLKEIAGQAWAQGLRLSLTVDNLFDDYQAVTDETGHTPRLYQRGLIDPMGRTVTLTLRKSF
ncbi:MAG: TonB-dependent receptor [Asticcacaulis sp.]|uniref:hypothetical protein n=1 Tax=Asticcacaulis sp. TaxID=1872648 RepID=UPI0039E25DF6